jgi:hypothetical protein
VFPLKDLSAAAAQVFPAWCHGLMLGTSCPLIDDDDDD